MGGPEPPAALSSHCLPQLKAAQRQRAASHQPKAPPGPAPAGHHNGGGAELRLRPRALQADGEVGELVLLPPLLQQRRQPRHRGRVLLLRALALGLRRGREEITQLAAQGPLPNSSGFEQRC